MLRCWPTTPPHKWTRCWSTTERARRKDAETTGAISAALLARYTSTQVDALLADHRTASAQDRQTQAAITGPGRFHDQPDHLDAGGVPPTRTRPQPPCSATTPSHTWSHGGSLSPANSRALSGRRRRTMFQGFAARVTLAAPAVRANRPRICFAMSASNFPTSWRACPRPTTSTTPCVRQLRG